MDTSSAENEAIPVNPMFAANMAAMARWAPTAHAALAVIDAPHSTIVMLPDGGIDVSFRGQSFYGRDAVGFAQEQFDGFVAEPVRWHFNRPNADALKGTAGKFIENVEASLAAENIGIEQEIVGQDATFAMIFGIGLGLHVGPLIDHTQARTIVLVEPLVENLYHSLFVVDWAALFEEAAANGRHLDFVLSSDSEKIATSVRNHVRARNPAMLDGVYVYSHYRSSVLDNALNQVRRDFFLNISGLGFFEDELVMLANGSANLNRTRVAIIDRQLTARETPVFIVGSGPSVDQLLPTIKKFRNKAIVISVGTGVRALRANDVTPDFHVELENVFGTAYVVDLVKQEFGLDGITLIAPITVRREVVDAFDDALLFFREKVTSTLLYKGNHRELSPAGPTVANTALIAAIRMGFRNITMFGLDMGTKQDGVIHSPQSVYGGGELEEMVVAATPTPANFGGTAFADNVFTWSRQTLEGVLAMHGFVDCCNCSDGALIKGALPKLPEMLNFDGEDLAHEQIKQELKAGMSCFSEERRQAIWDAVGLKQKSLDVAEKATAIFSDPAVCDRPAGDWSQAIYDLVKEDGAPEERVMQTLMYGTAVLMLGCAQWYALRLSDADQEAAYRRIALRHLQAAFAAMGERTQELLTDIEAFCNDERDDIPVVDWSLLIRPELAGKRLQA